MPAGRMPWWLNRIALEPAVATQARPDLAAAATQARPELAAAAKLVRVELEAQPVSEARQGPPMAGCKMRLAPSQSRGRRRLMRQPTYG